MVDMRAVYGFDKGDFAFLNGGQKLTIERVELRGSEGTLAYVFVHTTDGQTLVPAQIRNYEKA